MWPWLLIQLSSQAAVVASADVIVMARDDVGTVSALEDVGAITANPDAGTVESL